MNIQQIINQAKAELAALRIELEVSIEDSKLRKELAHA